MEQNEELYVKPLHAIVVQADSHLSDENYGYHKNYAKECLYYEELVNKIIEVEEADYYINAGDLIMKKNFRLDFRQSVDRILEARKQLVESRGGEMIYIRGNHDVTTNALTEYDYYAKRGMFKTAAEVKTLDFATTSGQNMLHLELKDWHDESAVNCTGIHNVLITHGLFGFDEVIEGDDMGNYGTAVDISHKTEWAGLEAILCGHIHSEHLIKGKLCDKGVVVHYLPCLARPQYIKKYEEGEEARRQGCVDIIRVYEDHIEIDRYEIDFLDNDVCFNVSQIKHDAASLAQGLAKKDRREALMSMAEELQNYERHDNDPIAQINDIPNVEQATKDIVIDWFTEAKQLMNIKA